MLYILTRVWVLPTPNAGQNQLFNFFKQKIEAKIEKIMFLSLHPNAGWSILSLICAIMTSYSFTVSYCFVSFYTTFSMSFLSRLDKKLINFRSKQYEPFLDFRRPLPLTSVWVQIKQQFWRYCIAYSSFFCFSQRKTIVKADFN